MPLRTMCSQSFFPHGHSQRQGHSRDHLREHMQAASAHFWPPCGAPSPSPLKQASPPLHLLCLPTSLLPQEFQQRPQSALILAA